MTEAIPTQPVINTIPPVEKEPDTFITGKEKEQAYVQTFSLHEVLIPAGKPAKLVKIPDIDNKDLRASEILFKLKISEPTPTILLTGAMTETKGKILAGLVRAAQNTDAIIIDSACRTGIEKFCIRRNVKLIGVAPESQIIYPKATSDKPSNELSNGHAAFIVIGNKGMAWGEEAAFKVDLAER